MFLVVIALIVIAFFLGWKLGDKVAKAVADGAKWLWAKIKSLFKKKDA